MTPVSEPRKEPKKVISDHLFFGLRETRKETPVKMMTMRAALIICSILPAVALAGPYTFTTGTVRIQLISPHLVRLELKGPRGFEDRKTFTVIDRDFSKVKVSISRQGENILLQTDEYSILMPKNAITLRDVQVLDAYNQTVYQNDGSLPPTSYMPAPGFLKPAWVLADNPRLVPPAWGATPAPKSGDPALTQTSGWDNRNDAPDIYVFIPGKLGYAQIRYDFLKLTGPIPKPPLSILGFIDSRYHPYTEKEALDSIGTYRTKRIPLDTFVVDTDWRINGSAGYAVEPKFFPDMPRFIQEAHDRHVKLMFNDHPDPKAPGATDPKELEFRWEGLTKLLNMGMDIWWYDRNWSTSLVEPMPGIRKEVWGQRLYHDITERARPTERPWIMTNAQGIDNGIEHAPPQAAGHRFPMMWTGDTGSQFDYLRRGVENGVSRGILALQPYTHEDLGGHTGPTPSPELYIRFLQYGCLSPITRVHCTLGQDRHPWAFGPEAEKVVTDFINLRYRLLPTLYTAAQHATDDGSPILRRCDLYWPSFAEAAHNDQYMLGDDILVDPIMTSMKGEPNSIPSSMFRTPLGAPGLEAQYFDNATLQGTPKVVRTDDHIDFDWGTDKPANEIPSQNFSVRWTGLLGPVPSTGDYRITTKNDDGIRIYVDNKLLIDDWKPEDGAFNQATLHLEAGSSHSIRVEFMQLTGGAICKVGWMLPEDKEVTQTQRSVWIPPGTWQDLWTGETVTGPKSIVASASISQIPMWVERSGIVLTGPALQYTSEKPMDPIIADIYVGDEASTMRELVEDDGHSTEYIKNAVARTEVEYSRKGAYAGIRFGATKGTYAGIKSTRKWIARFHLPKGISANTVRVDNKLVPFKAEAHRDVQMPFMPGAGPAEGDVVTIELSPESIRTQRSVVIELK